MLSGIAKINIICFHETKISICVTGLLLIQQHQPGTGACL